MERRRQPRIVYQSKIRLKMPEREDSLVARMQNLSVLGTFVTTSSAAELPPVQSELLCRLAIATEVRILRGRVAWLRDASPDRPLESPGAGIEFISLAGKDAELLRRVVDPGDEPRQAVEVWFEELATPVRCQALVIGQNVRLSTRLPFMRLNSRVKMAFGPQTREGNVQSVMLEPCDERGIPHLRLDVAMSLLDNAQGTLEIRPAVEASDGPPAYALASTVIDPAVSQAAPPSWLSVDGPQPTLSGVFPIRGAALEPASPASLAPPLPASPQEPGLAARLGRGWWPLAIGGAAGALLVSVVFLLLPGRQAAPQAPRAPSAVVIQPPPGPAPAGPASPAPKPAATPPAPAARPSRPAAASSGRPAPSTRPAAGSTEGTRPRKARKRPEPGQPEKERSSSSP